MFSHFLSHVLRGKEIFSRLHFSPIPVYAVGNWIPRVLYSWGCGGHNCGLAQAVFTSPGVYATVHESSSCDPWAFISEQENEQNLRITHHLSSHLISYLIWISSRLSYLIAYVVFYFSSHFSSLSQPLSYRISHLIFISSLSSHQLSSFISPPLICNFSSYLLCPFISPLLSHRISPLYLVSRISSPISSHISPCVMLAHLSPHILSFMSSHISSHLSHLVSFISSHLICYLISQNGKYRWSLSAWTPGTTGLMAAGKKCSMCWWIRGMAVSPLLVSPEPWPGFLKAAARFILRWDERWETKFPVQSIRRFVFFLSLSIQDYDHILI